MKYRDNPSDVISRRDVVNNLAKGAVVVAFHTGTRSWLTAAQTVYNASLIGVPTFDGRLVTDEPSLDAAAGRLRAYRAPASDRGPATGVRAGHRQDGSLCAGTPHSSWQRVGKGTARKGKHRLMPAL